MDGVYQACLSLLDSLRESLEQLSSLALQKADAANRDDLTALDEIMKQEQAMTLAFRGMEHTREKLLSELDCGSVPLSRLPEYFPPAAREEARGAVSALQTQYREYRARADAARAVLERHLHEIDGIIAKMGGTPEQRGPGYAPPSPPETPSTMKTDFRA